MKDYLAPLSKAQLACGVILCLIQTTPTTFNNGIGVASGVINVSLGLIGLLWVKKTDSLLSWMTLKLISIVSLILCIVPTLFIWGFHLYYALDGDPVTLTQFVIVYVVSVLSNFIATLTFALASSRLFSRYPEECHDNGRRLWYLLLGILNILTFVSMFIIHCIALSIPASERRIKAIISFFLSNGVQGLYPGLACLAMAHQTKINKYMTTCLIVTSVFAFIFHPLTMMLYFGHSRDVEVVSWASEVILAILAAMGIILGSIEHCHADDDIDLE